MKSRGFLVILAALALSACSSSPSAEERLANKEAENEELRGRIQELEEQLETSEAAAEDVESEAEEVRTGSAQLRGEVDRLGTENWRDDLPDIENATGQVATTQSRRTSGGQRRFRATAAKFFAMAMGKPFQEAASSLRQAHDPPVPLERPSADVDLDRPQD